MHGITGLHFAAFLAPCPHPPGSERVSLRLHGKFFTIPRGLQSLSLSVRLVEDTIVGTLVQRVHGKTWIQDTTRVWRERGWMKKSSRAKKIINLHEGIRANTTFVCVCVCCTGENRSTTEQKGEREEAETREDESKRHGGCTKRGKNLGQRDTPTTTARFLCETGTFVSRKF